MFGVVPESQVGTVRGDRGVPALGVVVDVDGVVLALHHFESGEEDGIEEGGRYLADATSEHVLELTRADDARRHLVSTLGSARADLLVEVVDLARAQDHVAGVLRGDAHVGLPVFRPYPLRRVAAVSYTHLTLPTKRIV